MFSLEYTLIHRIFFTVNIYKPFLVTSGGQVEVTLARCYASPVGINAIHAESDTQDLFESVFNFSIEVVLCHLIWGRQPEQARTTGTSEHFL
jgi:hypothetical protein